MSSEEQLALLKSSFDEVARQDAPGGVEYWYARDLQRLLGYAQWRNFVEVIEKAKISCETAGFKISDHFADVGKMVELGSGARERLRESEKRLSQNIYERGVDDAGFARIRSKGDTALFGGTRTADMKAALGVKGSRPLADFLPTLTIAAKNLATEITNHNVEANNLRGEPKPRNFPTGTLRRTKL